MLPGGKGAGAERFLRSTGGLALAFSLLTRGHLLARWVTGGEPTSPRQQVSSLTKGDSVPNLPVVDPGPEGRGTSLLLPDAGCQLLVAFDPACPYCGSAARRRKENPGTQRIPVTWVAVENTPEVLAFRKSLPTWDRVVWAEAAFRVLRIEAVPAAFLVRQGQTLARVAPYSGQEKEEELLAYCEVPGAIEVLHSREDGPVSGRNGRKRQEEAEQPGRGPPCKPTRPSLDAPASSPVTHASEVNLLRCSWHLEVEW